MSGSVCVPGPVIVPFTQQDPPKSEAIQTAVNLILGGFEKHRKSINCTNDRIDQLIEGGATLLASLNSGPRIGPRPNLNFIEGSNVTLQLNEDGPNDEFDLTISVPGLTGTVTNGSNVGTGGAGVGLVFRDKTGTILNFRALAPLSPLLGLTLGDQVLLALVINPVGAGEAVGSNRLISGTSPIRINGGASSNLQSDITVSYDFAPATMTEFFDEFLGGDVDFTPLGGSVNNVGNENWYVLLDTDSGGATVAIGTIPGENDHPGIKYLQAAAATETPASSPRCDIYQDLDSVLIEGGWIFDWVIRIPFFETNTTNFFIVVRVGFGDVLTADFVDGVYFEADPVQSTNWRIKTSSNSSATVTNTGTAIASNTWYRLRAVVNSGATSVEFFINGTSVGTIGSNIPTGAGRQCGPILQLLGDIGTGGAAAGNMRVHFDSAYYRNNVGISR